MNMRDVSNKPKTRSPSEKQLETDTEGLTKKELLEVYNCLAAAAKLFEEARKTSTSIRLKTQTRMARRAEAPLPKHLGRAHIAADSWTKRDLLCRRMSAWCYEIAKSLLKKEDYKNAQKWITLSARYLRLSMDPKKELTEEKLQELEDMVHEIQEREREEDHAGKSG